MKNISGLVFVICECDPSAIHVAVQICFGLLTDRSVVLSVFCDFCCGHFVSSSVVIFLSRAAVLVASYLDNEICGVDNEVMGWVAG